MAEILLVLNAGSSSLKFSLFHNSDPPVLMMKGQLERLQTEPRFVAYDAAGHVVDECTWRAGPTLGHQGAIEFLLTWGRQNKLGEHRLVAAGHRVVHGGTKFREPVRIDGDIVRELESLTPLAPLHQPHSVAVIRAITSHAPDVPQVACFDTSFHRTAPEVARRFALPRELSRAGIERYGFHGLSYEYIASKLPEIDPQAAAGRTIVAHLGNGSSLCALLRGVAVATTMGMTPLDGLPMGTRCGAIDPGVLLYLMDQHHMDARALEQLLYHESGLLGISGVSGDMRSLLEQEANEPHAAEAIETFVYRTCREVGSLAAALGGLDALIFTGGIGEHSAAIRSRICEGLDWLGLDFDPTRNEKKGPRISRSQSRVSAWVIPTDEEQMIARHTRQLMTAKSI